MVRGSEGKANSAMLSNVSFPAKAAYVALGRTGLAIVRVAQINLRNMLHKKSHIIDIQKPQKLKQYLCTYLDWIAYMGSTSYIFDKTVSECRLVNWCLPLHSDQSSAILPSGSSCCRAGIQMNNGRKHVVVASAYFPYDSIFPRPPRKIPVIVEYFGKRNVGLILWSSFPE